jgi:hypothetical protein
MNTEGTEMVPRKFDRKLCEVGSMNDKKTYKPPQLQHLGKLHLLTQGSTGNFGDGKNSKRSKVQVPSPASSLRK